MGGHVIMFELGKYIFLTVIYTGKPGLRLKKLLAYTIVKMEEKYESVLEKWNGRFDQLKGIENIAIPLLLSTKSSKQPIKEPARQPPPHLPKQPIEEPAKQPPPHLPKQSINEPANQPPPQLPRQAFNQQPQLPAHQISQQLSKKLPKKLPKQPVQQNTQKFGFRLNNDI